jgi:hypothetical protein
MKIYGRFSSKEMVEEMNKVGSITFENFDEYGKKFGVAELQKSLCSLKA